MEQNGEMSRLIHVGGIIGYKRAEFFPCETFYRKISAHGILNFLQKIERCKCIQKSILPRLWFVLGALAKDKIAGNTSPEKEEHQPEGSGNIGRLYAVYQEN